MKTGDKVLGVLQLFSIERSEWSVNEAAATLGLSASTAYRYFNSLVDAGMLTPIQAGRYVLGPAFIAYDRLIRHSDPLLREARDLLPELINAVDERAVAMVCRLYGDQVMCVHRELAPHANSAAGYERGKPMPLFRGASSKVILAYLPTRGLTRLYTSEHAQIADTGLGETLQEFRSFLKKIRTKGYWISFGEVDPGYVGVSAPIFGGNGQVIGSVGVALPPIGIDAMEAATNAAPRICEIAVRLSAALNLDAETDADTR